MKSKLSILYFLQFSVWGCYLTCLGQLLGAGGLGSQIAWFYAAIGIVSIITPSLFGRIADQTKRPERLLSLCHFAAACIMLAMWRYGMTHSQLDFIVFYPLYILFLALYMPTMALANTTSFGLLSAVGRNPVTSFPAIRIWGTVGFVGAMWFVNCAYWTGESLGFTISDSSRFATMRFQYNSMQLLCSSIMGFSTALFSLFIPESRNLRPEEMAGSIDDNIPDNKHSFRSSFKRMLQNRQISVFLIFVALSGVCMQISNGFVTPYITHFTGIEKYVSSIASGNATMLFSLSQISEAACILLVGYSLKRKGIKIVYALGLIAWALRFIFLGTGNPANGLWLLVGSMIIYGIAFNFITIAGHLYIQQISPQNMKGFAQGFMMFMSNGIGATVGTLAAGSIVNHWCSWEFVSIPGASHPVRLFMGDWTVPWLIFGAYAFAVALFWILFFRKSTISSGSTHPSI